MKRNMVFMIVIALLVAGCIWVPGRRGGVVVAPAPILAPPVIIAPGPPGPPGPPPPFR